MAVAFLSFVVASILGPSWYPAPRPVTTPDGHAVFGPDGKMLFHQDMAAFRIAMIPAKIAMICFAVCVAWLLIRFCRFVFMWWSKRKAVA